MTRTTRALAVLAACAAVAGCGSGDDAEDGATTGGGNAEQQQIQKLVTTLTEASRASDGGRICEEVFTEALRLSIKTTSGRRCGEEVSANLASPEASFELEGLQVTGTEATGTLVDQEGRRSPAVFVKQGGQWRISGIRSQP